MSGFKINKDLEKTWWIKRFGQPLVDQDIYRVTYNKHGCMRLFLVRSKRWFDLYEDEEKGFYYEHKKTSITEENRLYIREEIQKKIREAFIEKELLG